MLLSSGFAEVTEALARIDENTAWETLAAINGRIAQSLRDEGAKLEAKGYASNELKEISDRLCETIMATGQIINARRNIPKTPTPSVDAQRDPLEFAALVREAQQSNRKVA